MSWGDSKLSTCHGGLIVGITWNSVGGGVTWDAPSRVSRRRVLSVTAAAALAAGVAALPHASAATTPLANLSQVEQVVGVQTAWAAGATGQGVDVALIDTGVSPVPGLDA